jgi:cellulose synthase/poly-beta-1,6-N-acetylglucosamine synthase-like glycosyltransferase
MPLFERHSISVIFPAYNEALNIEKAVHQATDCLATLFRNWEIIIVNDGSRDDTPHIINNFAKANERIVAVHHPVNRGYDGPIKNCNRGPDASETLGLRSTDAAIKSAAGANHGANRPGRARRRQFLSG